MFGDPIFLLSLLAVFGLIGIWIYQVLQETLTDQSQQIIYISGLTASLVGIYRIFVNAGDLGSVLLIGSFICLMISLALCTGEVCGDRCIRATTRLEAKASTANPTHSDLQEHSDDESDDKTPDYPHVQLTTPQERDSVAPIRTPPECCAANS